MIKPKALKFGDTIGVIAPASPTTDKNIKKVEKTLSDMGFKVKMGKSVYERHGYLAGRDEVRASDVNSMFEDDEVDGIICIRGGYGTPRILDLIDFEIIKNNPKVFVGYSDITALHIAFNQVAGLVTFHGPMASSDMINVFSSFSKEHLFKAIMNAEPIGRISNPEGEEIVTIHGGIVEGTIIGGNLSLIADTIGTPYEIDVKGKILFIEEIEEEPYRIDRMLNQLRLSGKLDDAVGIILGDFKKCDAKEPDKSLTLEEVIDDYFRPLNKPIVYNLQAGHCEPMVTIPFGIKARLDADKKELIFLENAVE